MTWWFTFELIWLLLLILFLLSFVRLFVVLKKASHWLETEGEITECRWRMVGEGYWPQLAYVYHVDGKRYQGNNIFLDNFEPNPGSYYRGKPAFQWFSSLKQGEKVSVYYDVDEPDLAALSIAIPRKLYLLITVLSFLVAAQSLVMVAKLF